MALPRPILSKVLLAQKKRESTTKGGIILTNEGATGETELAIVLAVGPDVTLVKEGDTCVVDWRKSKLVHTDDMQAVVMEEEDILAVIEE